MSTQTFILKYRNPFKLGSKNNFVYGTKYFHTFLWFFKKMLPVSVNILFDVHEPISYIVWEFQVPGSSPDHYMPRTRTGWLGRRRHVVRAPGEGLNCRWCYYLNTSCSTSSRPHQEDEHQNGCGLDAVITAPIYWLFDCRSNLYYPGLQ